VEFAYDSNARSTGVSAGVFNQGVLRPPRSALNTSLSVDNVMHSYYIQKMNPIFEWDDLKNEQNKEKHGISFLDAQYAFADPHRVIIEDLDHGANENRFFCLGKVKGGIMTVRFTERQGRIRIIGAGYWRKGRKIYDQENQIHR